jgi:hypothetical protein
MAKKIEIKHDYEVKALPGGGVSFLYGRIENRYFGWNYVYLDGVSTAVLVAKDSSKKIIDKLSIRFQNMDPEEAKRFPDFKGGTVRGDEVTPIGINQAGNALYLEGCEGDGPMVTIKEGRAPLTEEEKKALLIANEQALRAEAQYLFNSALRRVIKVPDCKVDDAFFKVTEAMDELIKSR